LGALERGVLEETVSFSQEETLYTCWGDIFFPTASLLTVLWGVLLIFRQRRKSL
jgi:apolipoprotein N-acyltransferase